MSGADWTEASACGFGGLDVPGADVDLGWWYVEASAILMMQVPRSRHGFRSRCSRAFGRGVGCAASHECDLDRGRIAVQRQDPHFTPPKNGQAREAPLTVPAREAIVGLPVEGEFCFPPIRGEHWSAGSRAYHWKAVRGAAGWSGSLYLATRHFAG